MAITVNTKTPIAITVNSVGSGNSPYAKEHNPHRGGGGGHFAPASTGKFVSNEERLEKEKKRLLEVILIAAAILSERGLSVYEKNEMAYEHLSAALKEGE